MSREYVKHCVMKNAKVSIADYVYAADFVYVTHVIYICSKVLFVFIVVYAKRHMSCDDEKCMLIVRSVFENLTNGSTALRLKVVIIQVMHDQS